MKAIVYGTLIALAVTAVLTAVYLAGRSAGRRYSYRRELDRAGIDRGAARRYVSAARLLERLAADRDVTGLIAGDVLSEETQQMVTSWVAEHRKETQTR